MSDQDKIKALVEDISPFDWFETRFLLNMPEHFVRCKIPESTNRVELLEWIEKNTTGRFAIGSDTDSKSYSFVVTTANIIAFEDPSEATLYTLTRR